MNGAEHPWSIWYPEPRRPGWTACTAVMTPHASMPPKIAHKRESPALAAPKTMVGRSTAECTESRASCVPSPMLISGRSESVAW